MESNNLSVFGMASQVTLDLFATGKTSGIVIDSGHQHTQIAPIIEGLTLKNFQISTLISGEVVNKYLTKFLDKKERFNNLNYE